MIQHEDKRVLPADLLICILVLILILILEKEYQYLWLVKFASISLEVACGAASPEP